MQFFSKVFGKSESRATTTPPPAEAGPRNTTGQIQLSTRNEFPHLCAGALAPDVLTLIHLDAPVMQNVAERKKALCISAVLDVSGSMAGQKLALAKESLQFMVDELTDRDMFGIIAFDSNIEEIMPPTKMDASGKRHAQGKISAMVDHGSTNLSGGLFAGIQQVRKNAGDAAHSVILFTDGQANTGICNPSELIDATKAQLDADGVDLIVHTFGFGGDHNADLLRQIAEVAQGTYYYVKDAAAMKESFADCLGGLISVVAQNIRLEATVQAPFELIRVMTAYPTQPGANGTVSIKMKDLYSGEKRDVLISLRQVAPLEVGESFPVVKWVVRYDSALSNQAESAAVEATIAVAVEKYTGAPDAVLDEQRNRIRVTEAMAAAQKEADLGNVSRAQDLLECCQQEVGASTSAAAPAVQKMMLDVQAVKANTSSTAQWNAVGSKESCQKQAMHQQQRGNMVGDDVAYDNCFKSEMRKKHR